MAKRIPTSVHKTAIVEIEDRANELYQANRVIHLDSDDSDSEKEAEKEPTTPTSPGHWSLMEDLDYDSDADMDSECKLTKKGLSKFKLIGVLGTLLFQSFIHIKPKQATKLNLI